MGARRAIRPDRYPLIFARTVKLNPLAVLIAILLATELAGILGALLAIPVAGIIQVVRRGFDDHRAVEAYRAFSSFLLGHLLLEATLLGAQTGPAEEPLDEGDSDVPNADQNLDLTDFPQVRRLEAELSQDHATAEFEQALEDLLDRLDRFISE